MKHFKTLLAVTVISQFSIFALAVQTKVENVPDSISSKEINYTEDTFFSNRVANGQSTEGIPQNRLDLRIEHRFGLLKEGYNQFFGLDDPASTFFALEYGIKDGWMVGLNRSNTDKTVAGYTKFSLLRQSTGAKNTPVSLSLMLGASIIKDLVHNYDFYSRISYTTQVLIARKISTNFSAQFSPVWIHRNMIPSSSDANDLFALGFAARYKLTPTFSLNGEYYPVINPSAYQKLTYDNSLSLGFDIETSGHVFQIVLSNSTDMIEKNFIGETRGSWLKGDIHIGFNILRKFDL